MKNILISTGGSGGHVLPGLTIHDHLKKQFNTSIVTDFRGEKFISKKKYNYKVFKIPKISKYSIIFPLNIFKLFFFTISAIIYLKKNKINLLISTGGYMSFPFCLGANLLGIGMILFEPNMTLGRNNKFFLKHCKKIICYQNDIKNFPKKFKSKIFICEPILNENIYSLKKNHPINMKNEIKIIILGGSQGAQFFDNFVQELFIKLPPDLKLSIYQQVHDKNKIEILENKYRNFKIKFELFTFDTNILEKISNCNFAITRCGASTIAELAHLNIPFIGIPFPYSKDNHQFYNAEFYNKKNCCWLFEQEKIDLVFISNLIKNLSTDNKTYNEKFENLVNMTYQNSWSKINYKLINLINEN